MIGLGCDHGGYELMQDVKKHLEKRGIPYKDFGCCSTEAVDYPDYARLVGRAIQGDPDLRNGNRHFHYRQ